MLTPLTQSSGLLQNRSVVEGCWQGGQSGLAGAAHAGEGRVAVGKGDTTGGGHMTLGLAGRAGLKVVG